MLNQVLGKIFGTKNDRDMKKIRPIVDRVNSLESSIKSLTDPQLQAKTVEFKERIAKGEPLDQIMPEAFAVCREGGRRVLGMRHYDVQLIGGAVLHGGNIAEMRTGEGKTLVATLPVYLNALSGKGAHVVTVNDYLAKRDCQWMGRLYNWLGLSTGIIVHELNDRQRQESYRADITYGTNNEFGFDYLRDNMKFDLGDYVQREHNFAIVDECDSILVDEARTPLIISGPAEDSTDKYYIVDKVIPHLKRDVHFTMEEKTKTASLTDEGNSKVEQLLGIENLYDPMHLDLLHHVYQGLKAHHLYKRDVEYMIKDGEIVIVDEFTGRLMPGRRWSDGLHQAIEAKEGVAVKNENQTLATITFQNYFRMYNKLSGMTGTADTEAVEFKKIYNLDVIVIPTNRPMVRKDLDDIVYKTELAKFKAIAEDIQKRHAAGQPVLVGTVSIDKSERLSEFLTKKSIRHTVLNAKHHQREAEIIAQAGRKGSVTIATNMAGRGTDILLGGNPEVMAKTVAPDPATPEHEQALAAFREQCLKEREEVTKAGGLCIMGTERHESRRIDNQLRGRAGRQGDPGASQFYLSLEDNLMRIFNGERIQKIMNMMNVPEDEPIVAPMVTRSIEGAQKKVEGHNFDIRKHLLEYDDVMNKQRNVIYGLRREVLEGKRLDAISKEFLAEVTTHLLDTYCDEKLKIAMWDLEGLEKALHQQFGIHLRFSGALSKENLTSDSLVDAIRKDVTAVYDRQKEKLGPTWDQIRKFILLQTIDHRWKEHLQQIDQIKEGINLRAYAQKDPLIEYKKEAFNAFASMDYSVKSETVEKMLKVEMVPQDGGIDLESELRNQAPDMNQMVLQHGGPEEAEPPRAERARAQRRDGEVSSSPGGQMEYNPFAGRGKPRIQETVRNEGPKVGRNDPCPCGSGKKYKKCHGVDDA